MKNDKFDGLVAFYGSQVNLANALGVTRAAVTQWVENGGLPPLRAIQIEVLTDGQFKAVDLTGNEKDNEE